MPTSLDFRFRGGDDEDLPRAGLLMAAGISQVGIHVTLVLLGSTLSNIISVISSKLQELPGALRQMVPICNFSGEVESFKHMWKKSGVPLVR